MVAPFTAVAGRFDPNASKIKKIKAALFWTNLLKQIASAINLPNGQRNIGVKFIAF